MSEDALYLKVRSRIDRRLMVSPRILAIHALLFTLCSVPAGLLSMLSRPMGGIDGVVYWLIWFGSLTVLGHAGYTFMRSGAWQGTREKFIQEEVLDAGDSYNLNEEEMIDLHLQLDTDLKLQSAPFRRLILNALGNVLLWPGMLLLMMFVPKNGELFNTIFNVGLLIALLGTLLLGFTIPVRAIFAKQTDDHARLHAIYGYKRKRKIAPEMDRVIGVGDDGELVMESEEAAVKRKAADHSS